MSWILTFHTIFTARMGSFEVRAAAKLKDFSVSERAPWGEGFERGGA